VGKVCSTFTTSEISVFDRRRITTEITRCQLEIKGIEHLKHTKHSESDMMLINYQKKNDLVEDCPFGNVVLACFTTAHARLQLYKILQSMLG
jgi:hypothetical protein